MAREYIIKNRTTGVESPLTEEEFKKVSNHYDFNENFEVISDVSEPPEVTSLRQKEPTKQEEKEADKPQAPVKKAATKRASKKK